jgi:hypothetical protein
MKARELQKRKNQSKVDVAKAGGYILDGAIGAIRPLEFENPLSL